MRTDLYTLIHKAQRHHLFRAAEAIGQCDPADAAAVAGLGFRIHFLINHLHDHAANEEAYIHPLFQSIPGGALELERLERDHAALAGELTALAGLNTGSDLGALYAAFNRFLGGYLLHLAQEERAQAVWLWPHIPETGYAAVFRRFQAERSPEHARADLAFMIPALNPDELLRLFRGIKAAVPAPVFTGACTIASGILPNELWQRILAGL